MCEHSLVEFEMTAVILHISLSMNLNIAKLHHFVLQKSSMVVAMKGLLGPTTVFKTKQMPLLYSHLPQPQLDRVHRTLAWSSAGP